MSALRNVYFKPVGRRDSSNLQWHGSVSVCGGVAQMNGSRGQDFRTDKDVCATLLSTGSGMLCLMKNRLSAICGISVTSSAGL